MTSSSNRRELAKRLLVHYFRLLFEKTETPFEPDNQAELEQLVDLIFDSIDGTRQEATP